MQKVQLAKEKSSEGEIEEQIKLAYQEWQLAEHTGTPVNIELKLKEIFGDNNVSEVSVSNKILLATIMKKAYCYSASTGKVYIDKFNYGSKTRLTVAPGDDISIGTEKFKVISNTNGIILAMPYYNLVTVTATGEIKQGPEIEGISEEISTTFSAEHYWTVGDDAIDMSDSRNLIQKYINAYKSTLERLDVDGIIVRAAKYSELTAEGVTSTMRNPGLIGSFWLGSDYSGNYGCVWFVSSYGYMGTNGVYASSNLGVRPVVIIE